MLFRSSKAAMYPRVILDKSLFDALKQTQEPVYKKTFDQDNLHNAYLKKDFDDKLYFDYILSSRFMLDSNEYVFRYLQTVRKIILDGQKFKSPDIKVKYGWLKNKFNDGLEKLQKNPVEYGIYNRIEILQLAKIKIVS